MRKANKISRKMSPSIMAVAICTVAAGFLGVQAQETPIGGVNQPQTKIEAATPAGQPQKMNKCSQMIGVTVENPQGDKLGKIDEVVVDFDNGRVSYCVMSVAKGVFSAPKYLAVPLAALQPSSDGSKLILNADKDKVAQAEGFDRNNWPSITNQAWGAQPFWQAVPKAAITSPPTDQNKSTPTGTSR